MAALPSSRSAPAWNPGRTQVSNPSPARDAERARAALRLLLSIRTLGVFVQLVLVAVAVQVLGVELPLAGVVAILAGIGIVNVWTCYRLHNDAAVTDNELLMHLSFDTLALTAMLAMSGGASNPFAGIVLLPIALGASCLTWRSAWTLGFMSVLCYSVLLIYARPLEIHAAEEQRIFVLSAGMWVSYCVTAIVIVGVLLRVTYALRRGEQMIEASRRKAIGDEHIERIGALAAGAAHELSSPLASIAMIVDDLRNHRCQDPKEIAEGLEVMSRLLSNTRETLGTLLSYGNSTMSSAAERVSASTFLRTCVKSFAERRPECLIEFHMETAGTPPAILANRALRQALTSILDNAADVSPQNIELSLKWNDEWLQIRVRDRGPGIPPEVMDALGKLVFLTTKPEGKGNGLGLYLANTAVSRFGGNLCIANADDGGAVVDVLLPVCEEQGQPTEREQA
jgi:two-component system, sensor histidine kinase RegB